MPLHFGIARISTGDAVFHDSPADVLTVGDFDDVIAEPARELAVLDAGQIPLIMFQVETAHVIPWNQPFSPP